MELFKDYMGEEVDLDDMETYPKEWRRMKHFDLFTKCEESAGVSLFYMEYLNGHIDWKGQKDRVDALCKELSKIWNDVRKMNMETGNYDPIDEKEYHQSLMNWLYRFEDEVENQC